MEFKFGEMLIKIASFKGTSYIVLFFIITIFNSYSIKIIKDHIGFDKIKGLINLGPISLEKNFFFWTLFSILGSVFYSVIPFEKYLNKIFGMTEVQ